MLTAVAPTICETPRGVRSNIGPKELGSGGFPWAHHEGMPGGWGVGGQLASGNNPEESTEPMLSMLCEAVPILSLVLRGFRLGTPRVVTVW